MSSEDLIACKTTHFRCMKKYYGKSGDMKVEAAVKLCQRSEARGFRYTCFIGAEDLSAFNAVEDLN